MEYFKIAIKNRLIYKNTIFFSVTGSIVNILIKVALWRYLYQGQSGMIEYMVLYSIISSIIEMFYNNTIANKIGNRIIDGSIVTDMLKPINFVKAYYMQCVGEIFVMILLKGIPIVLFFAPVIVRLRRNIILTQLGGAVLALIMGHCLYMLLFIVVGLLAVLLTEIWTIRRILNDVILFLSGAVIPLALFPEAIANINSFLPFRFMFSFPLELLLQEVERQKAIMNFGILIIWLLVISSLVILLYHRVIRKVIINGG